MNIIRYRLYAVREFVTVGYKLTVCVSLLLAPAVVNDYVFIAGVLQPGLSHCVGGFSYQLVAYLPCKGVP